ncbi:MAG: hypothetical protein AAGD25_09285 [Cyanobacteria bacterium P01_F01_bin.150]
MKLPSAKELTKGFLAKGLYGAGIAIALSTCTSLLSVQPAQAFYWPEDAQPNSSRYDDAWDFTCTWDCGVASFEAEYGGHTVHGYSSTFFDTLPSSEAEAKEWAYYDFWLPAGCDGFSSNFARTVCFDTAFLHGVGAWQYFSSLYWHHSDDDLACHVITERAAARNPNAPYVEGWNNRDRDLASLGTCR